MAARAPRAAAWPSAAPRPARLPKHLQRHLHFRRVPPAYPPQPGWPRGRPRRKRRKTTSPSGGARTATSSSWSQCAAIAGPSRRKAQHTRTSKSRPAASLSHAASRRRIIGLATALNDRTDLTPPSAARRIWAKTAVALGRRDVRVQLLLRLSLPPSPASPADKLLSSSQCSAEGVEAGC